VHTLHRMSESRFPLTFTLDDACGYMVSESVDLDRIRKAHESGIVLRIKLGIDPTSPNLHLGRAIPLWRLRAFQELGHHIDLVIGDFTALVGDTSDKESKRPMLTSAEVTENLANYEQQLWMVLNPERKGQVTFHHNSQWLSELSFAEVAELADSFTVNQFIKRELVARRIESGNPVSLREMLYPVMQGYDSVALRSDVELGGSDQWFNLLAGRTLQEIKGQTPQVIITNVLINGTDGRKMSSSWGNVISLNQDAFSMYTQVMQIADDFVPEHLGTLPRSAHPFTAEEYHQHRTSGGNPLELKELLAHRIVAVYFSPEQADQARNRWVQEKTGQFTLAEVPVHTVPAGDHRLMDLFVQSGLVASNGQFKDLVSGKGARFTLQESDNQPELISEPQQVITLSAGQTILIQSGKHAMRMIQAHNLEEPQEIQP
jgi:tyrosyl-tRNA synthetase